MKSRSATFVLGFLGGLGQLAIAFMGDAIGGMSLVIVFLVIDAIVAIAGAAVVVRWSAPGVALLGAAGLGAVVALFSTTLLEIGVAAVLLAAVAATLTPKLIRS